MVKTTRLQAVVVKSRFRLWRGHEGKSPAKGQISDAAATGKRRPTGHKKALLAHSLAQTSFHFGGEEDSVKGSDRGEPQECLGCGVMAVHFHQLPGRAAKMAADSCLQTGMPLSRLRMRRSCSETRPPCATTPAARLDVLGAGDAVVCSRRRIRQRTERGSARPRRVHENEREANA